MTIKAYVTLCLLLQLSLAVYTAPPEDLAQNPKHLAAYTEPTEDLTQNPKRYGKVTFVTPLSDEIISRESSPSLERKHSFSSTSTFEGVSRLSSASTLNSQPTTPLASDLQKRISPTGSLLRGATLNLSSIEDLAKAFDERLVNDRTMIEDLQKEAADDRKMILDLQKEAANDRKMIVDLQKEVKELKDQVRRANQRIESLPLPNVEEDEGLEYSGSEDFLDCEDAEFEELHDKSESEITHDPSKSAAVSSTESFGGHFTKKKARPDFKKGNTDSCLEIKGRIPDGRRNSGCHSWDEDLKMQEKMASQSPKNVTDSKLVRSPTHRNSLTRSETFSSGKIKKSRSPEWGKDPRNEYCSRCMRYDCDGDCK